MPQTVEAGLDFSCEWLVVDADGRHHSHGSGDFVCRTDAAEPDRSLLRRIHAIEDNGPETENRHHWLLDPANVVFIAPGEHVLSVSCEVPGRSTAQIRRALPYVVEEFIASDLERVHIANGPIRRGQPVRCCVIENELLRDWLACLNTLGVCPGHLVSEAELLPAIPRGASVLIDNGTALLRTEEQAASVDRGNLLPAITSLQPGRLTLIGGALTDIEMSQLDLEIEAAPEAAPVASGAVLDYLAERWRQSHTALNLLQGDYTAEVRGRGERAQWYGVAWLGAAWLLLGLLGTIATGVWSGLQADALETESLAIYRSIFPQDQSATVQNIRRRMQARLGERPETVGKSVIEYAADLAAVMDPSMTLLGIDYHQARGEFATELLVRRYDDVDRVREALEARGVDAEITSAEQVEAGVQARLRMSGD